MGNQIPLFPRQYEWSSTVAGIVPGHRRPLRGEAAADEEPADAAAANRQ